MVGTIVGQYGTDGQGGWGGGAWTGGGNEGDPPVIVLGPGTAACWGAITATFTWNNEGNPANVPPPVAVIREIGFASWSGDGGSCTDGLGHTPVAIANGQVSSGEKWTVKQLPGTSFTYTCEPSANAFLTEPSTTGLPAGGVSVNYSVAAFSCRIRLLGVLNPVTDKRLLIGQQLRATVDLGGLPATGQTQYTWDITGGAPFASYTASTLLATYTGWQSYTETTGVTNAFFRLPDDIQITCNVQTATPALAFQLSEDLASESPKKFHKAASMGQMTLMPNSTSPVEFKLFGATYAGLNPWGMFYDYWVETPSVYGLDVGLWAFVQLVIDSSTVTTTQGTGFIQPIRGWSLDHSFPHPYRLGGGPWFPAGPFSGTLKVHSDRPGVQGISGGGFISLTIDSGFDMYAVYSAPDSAAGSSSHVYLVRQGWTAKGTCTPGSPQWSSQDTGSAFGNLQEHPRHATWNQVLNP